MMEKYAKNTILYGPPGTGKTFHIRKRAVDICVGGEYQKGDTPKANQTYNEKYEELLNEDRIRFITFHQSYGYEDFIEGIRPVMDGKAGELKYEIRDGVFKGFCQPNPTWIINASDNQKNFQYPDWFKENVIKLSDVASSGQDAMQRKMRKGDYAVILDRKDKAHYLAVGFCRILEDEPSKKKDESSIKEWFERKVEWLWKVSDNKDGIDLKKDNPNLKINRDLYICNDKIDLNLPASFLPKVFIIDEINRGNISKIFGELITLIEDDKRIGAENEMNTILPYSGDSFSVPENVCLLGTMNTADRSIALMDTALRRRFEFIEMMPDSKVLSDIGADTLTVGGEGARLRRSSRKRSSRYCRNTSMTITKKSGWR